MTSLGMKHLLDRRAEFEADWQRRLNYLVPANRGVTFDSAWQTTTEAIRLLQQLLSI